MTKPSLRQFTLATMLCVVLAVAIPLGIYAQWMQEIRSEEAAITKLVELGYFVSCSDIPNIPRPRPYPPSWFVARFAPGFQHATRVIGNPGRLHHGISVEPNRPYVRGADVPEFFLGDTFPDRKFDSGLQELGQLRQIQYVRFSKFTANLNDISGMGQCVHLYQLSLATESSFPSELLQTIANSCPNIERLHIAQQIYLLV